MDIRMNAKNESALPKINEQSIFTQKGWVIGIALFCSILWGSAFPVLKVSYIEMGIAAQDLSSKIILAGMRFFIGSILLFILCRFGLKSSLKVEKKVLGGLFLLGLVQTTLQYFFFYNGLAYTSGMIGAILTSMATFFVVILSHFIYEDDKINWRKALGLAAGFLGIFLVNWNAGGLSFSFSIRGEGFVMMSSIMNATGMMMAKRYSKDTNPFVITGWQMFMGSLLLITIGLPGFQPGAMTLTPKAWGLLLYSAFLSATAFSLWYYLLKYNKAGEITLYKFMIPVSGAFLSAMFIPGEQFTPYMFGALIFVSLGVVAVQYHK